ncbi:hypothetical protein [Lysobacter capsici]|uniref:hypothetical protein n=1 Tax=Lysobacter capsici TaxID=435897 RepID=UPI00287B6BE1|nr:hypothetical protein [Lysobacter capsici]WND80463.1 hypothetical protein RJ610_24835 [Lysobacter capsici]WND85660.1 hypothetical protein RJ609_24855 [Lysobacter capsici]
MSKIKGDFPKDDEVWTERGELRNPADRSDQPEQIAPDRRVPADKQPESEGTTVPDR